MTITIIVAMTKDRLIGKAGRLPWRLPEDLKFFKRTTTGHAVVMGRKTFESIGRPLPERRNIVLTRAADYPAPPGIDLVHSLDAALALCRRRRETRAFIIGGEALYAEALPIADEMIITHVVPEAPLTGDAFFPTWNEDAWDRVGPVEPAYPAAIRYRRIA
ncbi:MAG: dihydrofolate reductase [Phycisphaerae bacterium]